MNRRPLIYLAAAAVLLLVAGIATVAAQRDDGEVSRPSTSTSPVETESATTAAGTTEATEPPDTPSTASITPVVSEPATTTTTTSNGAATTAPPVPTAPPTPSTQPPVVSRPGLPRVIVDTDLGGDPDDIQSLVRAIHYSDVLNIEGIVSTEGNGAADPELIREWIERTDVDHLREMGYTDLMTEAQLLSVVRTGTRDRQGPGDGRSTEGSDHIIERARLASPGDPLWILAWGSLGTVAQALFDDPSIVPNIRIYSIGDFNSTSNLDARDAVLGVLDAQPELWWIENGVLPRQSRSTFRGVWEGGNQSGQWNRITFLEQHIRDHGTRSDGRFNQKLGNAFPAGTVPREAIGALKEGDSPTLLYLLSPTFGGVGDIDDPTVRSWGGKFRRADPKYPNYFIDLDCAEPRQCQQTISQHRVAFLTHWRDRWDRYDVPAGEGTG